MSRNRMAVAIGVLVVFIVVGGILVYARSGGGQNVTFDLTVTGGKTIKPSDLTVNKNDTVTINITSDMDGEVHLHVYDIHFETKKGQTVSQKFKADKSGKFPIEWESTSAELGRLIVNP